MRPARTARKLQPRPVLAPCQDVLQPSKRADVREHHDDRYDIRAVLELISPALRRASTARWSRSGTKSSSVRACANSSTSAYRSSTAARTALTCIQETRARQARPSSVSTHVAAWHEAPFFDEKERAALALADAVTLISDEHVPREVWDEASAQFEPDELAQLVWAITVINAWNRIAITTRMMPAP